MIVFTKVRNYIVHSCTKFSILFMYKDADISDCVCDWS
jgi:hypothetical protein